MKKSIISLLLVGAFAFGGVYQGVNTHDQVSTYAYQGVNTHDQISSCL